MYNHQCNQILDNETQVQYVGLTTVWIIVKADLRVVLTSV